MKLAYRKSLGWLAKHLAASVIFTIGIIAGQMAFISKIWRKI